MIPVTEYSIEWLPAWQWVVTWGDH